MKLIKKTGYPLLLTLAFILLFGMSFLLFQNYIQIQKIRKLRTHEIKPVLNDINKIQGWMTFDYINRSFNLPDDYLKKELLLRTVQYPKVTIAKVARAQGKDIKEYIVTIGTLITRYNDSKARP